jgi:glycosyltransferase involved in cell wall biosynthesis
MKVLFTIDSLQQGGAEQSIAHIIHHFSKDTQVSILYFYPKADLLPTYQELGCSIKSLNLQGKYDFVKGISGMKKIIQEVKPDVVVTSLYRSNIISRIACKLTGIKLIGTFVDDSYNIERRKTFTGATGFIKYYSTWFLDRITAFIPSLWIANSKYIGDSNAKHLGIPTSKIKVIYRGRNSDDFKEWEKPKNDNFTFVCIGRLYEKKGYLELIQAFGTIANKYSNTQLIIYGEGSYRPQMESQIAALKLNHQIILVGNVPNAWQKIYESNCFVFPSRFEGFSGALVEAMMTGIPIISSDIPMNLEAVENNKTALVHKLKDVTDLANKMEEMISNYPSKIEMGKRARQTAIIKFDIKNIAKQYETVLMETVNKK